MLFSAIFPFLCTYCIALLGAYMYDFFSFSPHPEAGYYLLVTDEQGHRTRKPVAILVNVPLKGR